ISIDLQINIAIFEQYTIHPQGVSSTHATSNLGIWLNGKIGLFQKYFANPNNGLKLVPNCL
ncbi:hypothetical protein, partial [Flavobacterium laiguense]|uniref:hypothetical protein n=1 Tax=Flavobacterium laiguense TaxID=2169409 RepID=UPI001CB9522A